MSADHAAGLSPADWMFLPAASMVFAAAASIALKAFNYGVFLFGIAHIVVLLQALQREEKGAA